MQTRTPIRKTNKQEIKIITLKGILTHKVTGGGRITHIKLQGGGRTHIKLQGGGITHIKLQGGGPHSHKVTRASRTHLEPSPSNGRKCTHMKLQKVTVLT